MADRVGIGYDIHRFAEGRKLIIGGIEIPYIKGLLGHSDADVLIHAICDALLGAAGSQDIGEHFPDTDTQYRDIDSAILLARVNNEIIKKMNLHINNIDTVIIAEEPNLSHFKKKIQQRIAEILEIPVERISIKAKTNEGLGEIGNKDAIASYAVASLTD